MGGGPAGYTAALEAAALGKKTILIEKELLGGTCLNRGCIPTKLFLGATAAIPELEAQARLKLLPKEYAPPQLDLAALQTRKDRVLAGNRKAIAATLKKAGVARIAGRGRLAGPKTLEIISETARSQLEFEKLILAVGSQNTVLPDLRPDGLAIHDSTSLLNLDTVPESLIVVGSGAIGLELGEFWSRMGSRIHLVEAMEHLAPREDPEIGKTLASYFKRCKWGLHTGAKVAALATSNGRALLTFADGTTLEAEKALVAVGRSPRIEELNLGQAGIRTKGPGWIITDETLRATPDIYAVGDCNGQILLAHAGTHQAKYAAKHAAGVQENTYDPGPVPFCVYGACEAMRVGPTAEELTAAGHAVRVSKAPLAANAITQSHGSSLGFVKAVWSENTLRGVCAVGHGVMNLVMQALLLISFAPARTTAEEIMFAHPTLDEALCEALLAQQTDP